MRGFAAPFDLCVIRSQIRQWPILNEVNNDVDVKSVVPSKEFVLLS